MRLVLIISSLTLVGFASLAFYTRPMHGNQKLKGALHNLAKELNLLPNFEQRPEPLNLKDYPEVINHFGKSSDLNWRKRMQKAIKLS